MKRPHFALPEIYDESLSYYDVLRKLIKSMHLIDDNLNKIPEQIANEAKARLLGDQNLQQNINSEATTREQADNSLQEKINTNKNDISELKSELANKLPKSPVNWGPWTAEEQAVARARMDADGSAMEFIADITTTEDADVISIDKFPDGTPLKLKSFDMYFIIPKESVDDYVNSGYNFKINNETVITNRNCANKLISSKYDTYNNMYVMWNNARPIGFVPNPSSWANGSSPISSMIKYDNTLNFTADYICEVHLQKYNNSIQIPSGTRIVLWGVRA